MEQVELVPAKRFFVEMLTRDIELVDAILDLIDNSLDGAMRLLKGNNRGNHHIRVSKLIYPLALNISILPITAVAFLEMWQ